MLTPLSPDRWDRAKAAHLLNRAGFGGSPEEIDALAKAGFPAALSRLVDGPPTPPPAPAPDWAQPRDLVAFRQGMREKMTEMMAETPPTDDSPGRALVRKEFAQAERKTQVQHLLDLSGWWLDRMHDAEDPLAEKLTLFWHGHFATSSQKVRDGYLMWRQNQTFREHARGNFGALVKAMSRDPAMIQWLDLQQSRPQHANENFARELMELFTLGEGNYSEKDVTESARAFTGYRVDPRNQRFQFAFRQHDGTSKQFLGRTGNFDGDGIIDIILQQPACAQFIARKLWTFFAYENPSPAVTATLANSLRANKYEMRPVLRELFASAEFYSPQAMRTQIKSPVQWMVQTARMLDADLPPTFQMLNALRQMGQMPFAPPNVKGWDGGKAWISTSTLLFRYNMAGAFLKGAGPGMFAAGGKGEKGGGGAMMARLAMREGRNPDANRQRVDLQKLAPPELRADPAALVSALTMRLFQDPLTSKEQQTFVDYLKATGSSINDQSVRGVLHLMMSTPQFQLC
jgi:uncharacterized protein (DUF1800 family)